ncbi:hypothetical protein KS4_03000 [Poriferisphaera corsica]|uniref:Uncharacterized protein n=1 Tax=Poriferisphaera corsica TaxID=2528020 RepID=A0A517YPW4_9BACT|nr:hypothetical protein [Poriferisphaera corsica]QDU32269.1 hypothetical protein KS4_03000 [Poriferisphaera corsica]
MDSKQKQSRKTHHRYKAIGVIVISILIITFLISASSPVILKQSRHLRSTDKANAAQVDSHNHTQTPAKDPPHDHAPTSDEAMQLQPQYATFNLMHPAVFHHQADLNNPNNDKILFKLH